jgi:hypothetical protein
MSPEKKCVRIVLPTHWDARQLAACRARWASSFDVLFDEPSDDECSHRFPVLDYIDEVVRGVRGAQDGVFSSSDYPGATVAAAIATRRGLPGPHPRSVIGCGHKYYSRILQRDVVPEATPWFGLVDPLHPPADLPFPLFVKPVKGSFSQLARRIDSFEDLEQFLARPSTREFFDFYMRIFDQMVEGLTDFELGGRYFIAEGILSGEQTTVEGFVCDGEVVILGVVDSILHPFTRSFIRFDYPSSLSSEVQEQMEGIARRIIAASGLERSFFNVEMVHDPTSGATHILEVNPRICGQFGDLYEKVDGRNSYEMALELATGLRPEVPRRAGAFACAASVPLRTFRPARVQRVPSEERVREVEAAHPGMLTWIECQEGQILSDFELLEDGQSCRYAVVNLGAQGREDLLSRVETLEQDLGLVLEPWGEGDVAQLPLGEVIP